MLPLEDLRDPMAKRARGTSTRPGQRAPLQRKAPIAPRFGSPVSPPSIGLTPAEEARAAEIEAEIVQQERVADRAAATTHERTATRVAPEPRVRTGSIAVRAAEEYGYVSRDVRRIVTIGGSLVLVLLAIWIFTQATGTRLY